MLSSSTQKKSPYQVKNGIKKIYTRHTGYPGGQRTLTANELLAKDPRKMVQKAVKGMLPKNTLGAALFRNLNVYVGTEHPHEAQKPTLINLNDLK